MNREGFNFELAMVKACSTWPLLNKYALQKKRKRKIEVGLRTPPFEVMMESEDTLKCFKGQNKMCSKGGQVEHIMTMANLKLKPSLFTACPNVQNFHHIKFL